jgi:hypothetical protein
MPSQRKQLNMRISEEAEARLGRLVARMSAFLGNQYSQSDVVATALAWLEMNLPAAEAARYIPPAGPSHSPESPNDERPAKRRRKGVGSEN